MIHESTKVYDDLDAWLQVGKDHHKICVIVTVCSQCGKALGIKDGRGQAGISHSLCTPCLNKYKQTIAKFKGDRV